MQIYTSASVLCAASLLQELVEPAQQEAGIKLQFFERAKTEDGSTQIQKLLDVIKEQCPQSTVGALSKACPPYLFFS